MESARAMLLSKPNLPPKLWAEAVNSTVYILNRTAPTRIPQKTPFELWTGKPNPSIKHLRIFGTECYVHIPKEKRKKLSKKAYKGNLVGYEDNADGYRIYVPELDDVLRTRDVRFSPEKCVMESSPWVPEDTSRQGEHLLKEHVLGEENDSTDEGGEVKYEAMDVLSRNNGSGLDVSLEPVTKVGPTLRDRSKLRTNYCSICPPSVVPERLLLVCDDLPKTAKEARSSSSLEEWETAMKE